MVEKNILKFIKTYKSIVEDSSPLTLLTLHFVMTPAFTNTVLIYLLNYMFVNLTLYSCSVSSKTLLIQKYFINKNTNYNIILYIFHGFV